MKRWHKRGWLWTIGITAALAGCGGGGSSGGSAGLLQVSPPNLSVTTMEGADATLRYTLTIDASLSGQSYYVAVKDSGNALAADWNLNYESANTSMASFTTGPRLAPGVYTGTLEFQVCRDSACTSILSAVPATAQYQVTVQAAPPAAVLSPTQITASAQEGDALTITLQATLRSGLDVVEIVASDPDGVIQPGSALPNTVGRPFAFDLLLSPTVPPGSHSGTLTLVLCSYEPCTPDNAVPGGVISIPYSVTISPFVIPPPVVTASGLPEWETFQGNAGHTGYVQVTLDPSRFAPRWTWAAPSGAGTLSPATTGSGRLAFSGSSQWADGTLYVLNEFDGSLAWSHGFGPQLRVDDPGIYGGQVFVGSTDSNQHTFMWAFDLQNGASRFQVPMQAQWPHYLAPAFHAGYLYTNGGEYGGIYAFKQTTGVLRWLAAMSGDDTWTPGVDDRFAYAFTAARFHAVDIRTGSDFFAVDDPLYNWMGYSLNIAPVVTGEGHVLVIDGIFQEAHPNHLISYSINAQNEAWHVSGSFVANPVTAHGVIYTLNANTNSLEARDLSGGSLLWSWTPTGSNETLPVGNLVLADNLIFLCTSVATYAIDLSTHLPVWNIPLIGQLAMSSGPVLYVVAPLGRVDAFNLH